MTEKDFDELVEKTLESIRQKLIVKGKEYRRGGNVFHNFEQGSKRSGLSREKVLDGFLLKHEISLADMTNDLDSGILPTIGAVEEKFEDDLIYTIIKKAMFVDRINQSSGERLNDKEVLDAQLKSLEVDLSNPKNFFAEVDGKEYFLKESKINNTWYNDLNDDLYYKTADGSKKYVHSTTKQDLIRKNLI